MAKVPIDLESSDLTISDITYEFCKTVSSLTTVSTSGSTLTECASGSEIYILDNPNVIEDSIFRVFVTADSAKEAKGVFSPADGDIGLESTNQSILIDTNEIQGKLPSGTISDFDNTTETVLVSGAKSTLDSLNDIDLSTIEASTILAKEATLTDATSGLPEINNDLDTIISELQNPTYGLQALSTTIAPSGNNLVTINVEDIDTSNPVPDVFVRITDSAITQTLAKGYTDSSGQYQLSLDDGDYNAIIRKAFYDFTVPEPFTVSGSGTFTLAGSGFSASTPSTSGTCVVYGWVIDMGNAEVKNAVIKATEANSNRFSGIQKIVKTTKTVRSDSSGYFEIELNRSSQLTPGGIPTQIKITYSGFEYTANIIVPDANTAEFSTVVT